MFLDVFEIFIFAPLFQIVSAFLFGLDLALIILHLARNKRIGIAAIVVLIGGGVFCLLCLRIFLVSSSMTFAFFGASVGRVCTLLSIAILIIEYCFAKAKAPAKIRMENNPVLQQVIKQVRMDKINYIVICMDGIRLIKDEKQPKFPQRQDIIMYGFMREPVQFPDMRTSYKNITSREFIDYDFMESGYQKMTDEKQMKLAVKVLKKQLGMYRVVTRRRSYEKYRESPDHGYNMILLDLFYILSKKAIYDEKEPKKEEEKSPLHDW